jgi:hypothetical protein
MPDEQALLALRIALGDTAFEAAWRRGDKLSLEQAIDDALSG